MRKKIIYGLVALLIVIAFYVGQHLIRYWSSDADSECAAIVAAHTFMGTPFRQTMLAIPTVKSCSFAGGADLPFLTDEASVCAHTEYAETNTVDLVFNLFGRKVYPASPRTKYFIERLATFKASGRVPDMAVLLQGAPNNDTRCSPDVLSAVALK